MQPAAAKPHHRVKDATHSTDAGLHMLAVMMVLGAIAILLLKKPAR